MKYINRIGVELEGGWKIKPASLKRDGSLINLNSPFKGEVISQPLSLKSLLKWIPKNLPDEVNESCGFHVHVSLKDIQDYVALMDSKFYDYFLLYMSQWSEEFLDPSDMVLFKNRIKGLNKYCKKEWNPCSQVDSVNGNFRRTQLNFCYSKHKTLECRLFPAFKSRDAYLLAVLGLIDCYETYLTQERN